MPPHSDAPSPTGSFTTSHFRYAMRSHAVQSPQNQFNHDHNHHHHHQNQNLYNDAFETSSVDSDMSIRRALLPGIHVPTPAFFDPVSEDLDLDTIGKHAVRLAEAGVQGITTQGSNGEAVHMSHKERNLVTATTRHALDNAGYGHLPIVVGCG